MTELVEPSPNSEAETLPLSAAIRYAFGDGFVVDSGNDMYASDTGADGPLGGFEESHSSGSLTVEISSGEAFVGGKYLWIDEPTEVEVESNTFTTVEVGWPASSGNDVRIDHEDGGDYPSTGETIPLWTFSADSDGVTSAEDVRDVGVSVNFDGRIFANGITSHASVQIEDQTFIQRSDGDVQSESEFNGDTFTLGYLAGSGFNSYGLQVGRDESGGDATTILPYGDVAVRNGDLELEDEDATLTTPALSTGGGNSELHYERLYRDEFDDEIVSADIPVTAGRGQIIYIDDFRPDESTSLYLRFDNYDDENYYYTAEDAETGDHHRITDDDEFALVNNVNDEGFSGFAGKFEVRNSRAQRPSLIGQGTTRFFLEGEEILQRGSLGESTQPDEINIYTYSPIERCEIEVLEPVPEASRPTGWP